MPHTSRLTVLAASAAVALVALAGCSSSSGSSSSTSGSSSSPAKATAAAGPSAPSGASTSSTGLTLSSAEAACQLAGVRAYPFGFDPHWSLGFVSADASGDAWVIKAHADVAEEQGKRADRVVTCTVGGTDDAPQVASVTLG